MAVGLEASRDSLENFEKSKKIRFEYLDSLVMT